MRKWIAKLALMGVIFMFIIERIDNININMLAVAVLSVGIVFASIFLGWPIFYVSVRVALLVLVLMDIRDIKLIMSIFVVITEVAVVATISFVLAIYSIDNIYFFYIL